VPGPEAGGVVALKDATAPSSGGLEKSVRELTPEQRTIVGSRASRVFVSAAAGSGKTSLLVARYLRAVGLDGLSPAHVPMVTFTRRAAGEIKHRVREALLREGHADLVGHVESAPIGTIHSLCSRIIRSEALAAGVDPHFVVLDEEQAAVLEHEAGRVAWDEVVLAATSAELACLSRHGHRLRRDVPRLYHQLRQEGVWGDAGPGLTPPPRPLEVQSGRESLERALDDLLARLQGAKLTATAEKNLERVTACREWLPSAGATWRDLEIVSSLMPSLAVGKTKPLFEDLKAAMRDFRSLLGAHYLLDVWGIAQRLLVRFDQEYGALKSARSALDFADLEALTLRVLRTGRAPFPARSWLMVDEFQDTNRLQCELLDRLGVGGTLTVGDPYQSIYGFRGADVRVFRELQDGFEARTDSDVEVSSLSVNFRSRKPLIDALNSIFGHEHLLGSDFPKVVSTEEAFPTGWPPAPVSLKVMGGADDAAGEGAPSAVSSHGGRCAAEGQAAVSVLVVASAEDVAVEGGSCSEGTPDNEDGNRSGNRNGNRSGTCLGVDAETGSAPSPHEAEASVVAARVSSLLREGTRPREVVVLLRALTHVHEYERALRAASVPCYVVQGRGFFDRSEVADTKALLRLLLNPRDDAALATVLRSPLLGLSDDVALLLRDQADRQGQRFLWETIEKGELEHVPPRARGALLHLVTSVNALRSRLGSPGLAHLIEGALIAFDYDLVVLGTDEGAQRFANLRKLMRIADEFESVEGPDLRGLLEYLALRTDISGDREGGAHVLSEEDDVVRVMTIHQAKGLEFPVVVVPGMGTAPRDHDRAFLKARSGVPALRVGVSTGSQTDHITLGPFEECKLEERSRDRDEVARLYYVASTRAMHRLILVGSTKAGCPVAGGSPLADVLEALGMGPDMPPALPQRPLDHLDIWVEGVLVPYSMVVEATAETARDAEAPVEPRLAPPAPVPLALEVGTPRPRQVSFSLLSRAAECPRAYYFERVLRLPPEYFRHGESGRSRPVEEPAEAAAVPGARVVGIVVHRVLERVGSLATVDRRRLRSEVEEVVRDDGMTLDAAASARAVELSAAFWDSPYRRTASHALARRERQFLFDHDGVAVTGLMDLVVEEADRWIVIDFKTNSLEGREVAEIAAQYDLQVRLYALAALLSGAREVEVVLLFLESPRAAVVRTFAGGDIAGLRRALSESIERTSSTAMTEAGAHCGRCPWRGLCRSLPDCLDPPDTMV